MKKYEVISMTGARRVFFLMILVVLPNISRTASQKGIAPPANAPAAVEWSDEQGKVSLRYHDAAILDAVVMAEDKEGKKIEAGIDMATKRETGEKVEQRLTFTLARPQAGVALVLRGTVTGSEEAFPAETDSAAQRRFPYIRNSVGLSRNLRNNAVYDRRWDWVLVGPGDGATRIAPKSSPSGGRAFDIQCEGKAVELIFRPRFYQKHKNLRYFEPWTYKVWDESVTGFCTWWAYKGNISQDTIDNIVAVFKNKGLVDFGYEYLQIDAGWSTGSSPEGYLNWNNKFPGGPQHVVRTIKEAGMKPGIHTAIVFRQGDKIVDGMAKEHPDWFLQTPDGTVLKANTYTLNPFNEKALEGLIRPTYKGLKEQGWDYVKIDGEGNLMAWGYSEYPEYFKKHGTTPGEALRRLNHAACEELGDDVFVLACWSVRPELVGLIDGCRLGRDGYGPAEFQYFNSYNGVVWINDPDHCDIWPEWVKSRALPWYMECVDDKPKSPKPAAVVGPDVSDTIVRPCIVSMASGMLMLSDKMEVYEDDRNTEGIKRASPVLFSVPGQLYDYDPVESDRITNDTTDNLERLPEPRINLRHPQLNHAPQYGKQPTWWMQEIDKPFENWSVLARFNWRKIDLHWSREDRPAEEVRFSDLGLSGDKEYLVYEFWGKRLLGRCKGTFTAPAQDANDGLQVFAIREAREHPWVLSTSRHISQGGVDLLDEQWDAGAKTLAGKSRVIAGDPYVLTLYVPDGYRLERAQAEGKEVRTANEGKTSTVRIVPSSTKAVGWTISFAAAKAAVSKPTDERTVALRAVQPLRLSGKFSVDRSMQNTALDLGDVVYATGLGVQAGSELTYDVNGRSGRFEAWAGIDPNASAQRSGRFRVYADQNLVFDSGVIDQAAKRGGSQNPTRPIRVAIPLDGVKTLRLTFQCEDGKDEASLCGGWGDAKFIPASAPEYEVGRYEGTTLAPTPPMGWNSWCRYGTDIDEGLIKKVADAMVASGMRDAGYVYVGLDDGWQAPGATFDEQGYPLWDTKKFPGGMKVLGDYLHQRGLKYGIYSRAGWVKGHEKQFAERFAEWGVDLVKYDFSTRAQQKATLDAIRAAGRDVVFSVCEWGRERPWLWAPGFNAAMWRTTYDVKDKWTSKYDNNGGIGVLRSAHQNEALGPFVGPGRWNDLDMLQIGVDGFDYGHDRKKAGFDITPDEERLQMSLWAVLASPLLAANDVTAMNDQAKAILLNKEIIAINQDPLGVPGWRVKKMDQVEVWKRPLAGGDIAVALVNLDQEPRSVDVTWAQLNISGPRKVRDVWAYRDLGLHDKRLTFDAIPPHGVAVVRLSR